MDGDDVSPTPRTLSLRDGDGFMVCDAFGDIVGGAEGVFRHNTRVLSRLRLLVGEKRPWRLACHVSADNAVLTVHGANRALPPMGGGAAPRGVVHLERRRCLSGGRLYERLRLTNFGLDEILAPIAYEFDADFHDIFEVRGLTRAARGDIAPAELTGRGVVMAYMGLDGVERRSAIAFSEPPWRLTPDRAEFMLPVTPGRRVDLFLEVGSVTDDPPDAARFESAVARAQGELRRLAHQGTRIVVSDGAFDAWLTRARADIAMLTEALPTGPYPYAGTPWFSTPFGRDGIICAWQLLWLDPARARGVLAFLAANQATHTDAFTDAQPGKILHETRRGEMAALGEVPFGAYYGGVDTTPLFIALAGAYLERTADLAFVSRIWPQLIAAAQWLETLADSNGDGFIDYARGHATGLANQGWKDSEDSVFHADGRLATGPIALVEAQGYAFAAWRAMSDMGLRLGDEAAAGWAAKARELAARVEARFWLKDLGGYAPALDGDGEPCRVETSNPGHLLFVGLPSPERARRVIRRLLSPAFDTGWGLRTLAAGQARYNPMSYHNGSVWPHDTALCLAGMARYGERAAVARTMGDLFEASKAFGGRMPELLCGFAREPDAPPIAYPSACMPQAWAAGAPFMMLSAALGLKIDAVRKEVRLVRPRLPEGVERIALERLDIAGSSLDIEIRRLGERTAVTATSGGSVAVVVEE